MKKVLNDFLIKRKVINSLSEIFTEDGTDNDYSKFSVHTEEGVYVFINKDNQEIIYIGEGQNLSERLKQHFQRKDSGSTLRKNILDNPNTISNLEWEYYKKIISNCLILIVKNPIIKRKEYEKELINFFKPIYNKKRVVSYSKVTS